MTLEASVVVVLAVLTVSTRAPDVLPVKFPSPLYFAVIECVPPRSGETLSCALLLETVADPSDVAPSKNVTLPVALPPLIDGNTVAVNVTVDPYATGFWLDAIVMLEETGFTVSVNAAEVLAK